MSKTLGSLKVGHRFALVIAGGCFVGLALLAISTQSLGTVMGRAGNLHRENKELAALSGIRDKIGDERTDVWMYIDDPANRTVLRGDMASSDSAIGGDVNAFMAATADPAKRAQMSAFEDAWTGWQQVRVQVLQLADTGDQGAARDLGEGRLQVSYGAFEVPLDALQASLDHAVSSDWSAAQNADSSAARLLVLVIVSGILGAFVIGWAITRSVTGPLARAVSALDDLAKGDLTGRLEVSTTDEVGHMGTALNAAIEQIEVAVATIDEHAQVLAGASEELSSVSKQMASSAKMTAANADSVSAAATELSAQSSSIVSSSEGLAATIGEIAGHSSAAAVIASSALREARSTRVLVNDLDESVSDVESIVKVIDSISDQTNLLALNATIEAARAGEAGRGFAVVASEVKDLAQKTSRSTKDIRSLLEKIQGDTRTAVTAIGGITEVVDKVNETQESIASAVEEQRASTSEIGQTVAGGASGISQIAVSIGEVAATANETLDGASQVEGAARELAHVASDLRLLVGQWRHNGHVESDGIKGPHGQTQK